MLDEPESEAVSRELGRHVLTSSRLLLVEARRAVARAGDVERLTLLDEEIETVDLLNIDDSVLRTASRIAPASLRSLDAIHLATALLIPGVDFFVCLDDRLSEAASTVGLRVVSPR